MDPIRRRLAELYWKRESTPDQFTEEDMNELWLCLKANYHHMVKLSKLESLLDLTISIGQHEWSNEIGRQIDKLEGLSP